MEREVRTTIWKSLSRGVITKPPFTEPTPEHLGDVISKCPFTALIVCDFITPEFIEQLHSKLHLVDQSHILNEEDEMYRTSTFLAPNVCDEFDAIGHALSSSKTKTKLSRLFDVDLSETKLAIGLTCDTAGYYLNPHTDNECSALIGHVCAAIDPERDDYGTVFYSLKKDTGEDLSAANQDEFDNTLFQEACQLPYRPGCGYFFHPGSDTVHGVKNNVDTDRWVLLFDYLNDEHIENEHPELDDYQKYFW